MKAFEQLERLKRMNRLIKEEHTGTPQEFAYYLGISERLLYKLIEEINDLGMDVKYSRIRNTFYYDTEYELEISYSFRVISPQKLKLINGGNVKKTSLLFLCSEAM